VDKTAVQRGISVCAQDGQAGDVLVALHPALLAHAFAAHVADLTRNNRHAVAVCDEVTRKLVVARSARFV
jgi:hypothetical protein